MNFSIIYTYEFKRLYQDLPLKIQKKAEQKEKFLRTNPFHPSLNTEKINPKSKEGWSFRIDLNYRIIFRFADNKKIIFLAAGHKNWIYRYKF